MEKLHAETGVTAHDVMWRMIDYGVQHFMLSHHPMLVAEPFTVEPGESYSVDELDEYVEILRRIVDEHTTTPTSSKPRPIAPR